MGRTVRIISVTIGLSLASAPIVLFGEDDLSIAQRVCVGSPLTGFTDIKEWKFGVSYDVNGASIFVKSKSGRILQQPLQQFKADIELLNRMWFSACTIREQCRLRNPAAWSCWEENEEFLLVQEKVGHLLRENSVVVITPAQKVRAKEDVVQIQAMSRREKSQTPGYDVLKIEKVPILPVVDKSISSASYYQRAIQNQAAFRPLAAFDDVRAALSLEPNNDDYLIFAARLARELDYRTHAVGYLKTALELRRTRHKEAPWKAVPVLNELATIRIDEQKYDQAQKNLEESEKLVIARWGKQSPELITIYNRQGLLRAGQGKPAVALELYEKALKLYANAHGRKPDLIRATVALNVAIAFYDLSKQEDIGPFKRRELNDEAWAAVNFALTEYGNLLGPNHPDVANVLLWRVIIRDDRGCLMGSGDACTKHVARDLDRALEIYSFVYERSDPRLVNVFVWTAKRFDNDLMGQKALLVFEQALALRQSQVGDTHYSLLDIIDPYTDAVRVWRNPLHWPDDPKAHEIATASLLADLEERRRKIEASVSNGRLGVVPSVPLSSKGGVAEIKPGTVFTDRLPDGSEGPALVVIGAGTFRMGSPPEIGAKEESPQHLVTIRRPYAIGRYEVTQEEYERFRVATGRERLQDERGRNQKQMADPKKPVINLHWQDARDYTLWLSEQTGKHYRLPTEAEWEYAARAGTTTLYWWGDTPGRNHAICGDCGSQWDSKQTAPVGSFQANPWGLYDTVGNAWEWVMDCWHSNYKGAPTDGSAWLQDGDGDCSYRVKRGGSFYSRADLALGGSHVTSTHRRKSNCVDRYPRCEKVYGPPWRQSGEEGFRVVREID